MNWVKHGTYHEASRFDPVFTMAQDLMYRFMFDWFPRLQPDHRARY